ncbi:MAG: glyceraldehyde 3-phosphate dehydrogenase NAD-binding domain-containing protein [Acidobacteriota bacterium]
MSLSVGINGAGRIGRALLRHLSTDSKVRVVAVNELADAAAIAHLLQYDSVHGRFPAAVAAPHDDSLQLGDRSIAFLRHSDPAEIPWQAHGVDLVVEATGRFATGDDARRHLRVGPRRVLVSAVCPGADATVVLGIHAAHLPDSARVVSAASCTTHAAALPLSLLQRWYGLAAAEVTTVHCTTGSQVTIDAPHTDWRRGRSALVSMIPTTTTAVTGLAEAIPSLAGRITCLAIRVPTAAVSLVEIVAQTLAPLDSIEQLRNRFRAAAEGELQGLLGTSDEPLVSIDFKSDPRSSIIDLPLTVNAGSHLVRVFAWYDNEWGYSQRIADLLRLWEGIGI